MAEYLHIYISPKDGVTRAQMDKKLNLAIDWYRYARGLYVVYTTSSADKWKARLIDFVKPQGRLFICRMDASQRQGWMNKDFWDWLKKERKAV